MPLTLKEAYARYTELRFLRDDSIIEARSDLLDSFDRDLIRAVLIFGEPIALIASLSSLSTSSIRRRVRKVVKRIGSAEFIGAARALRLLNDTQSCVVRNHILQGKSLRATAKATGLPYHAVRTALAEARGIIGSRRQKSRQQVSGQEVADKR